MKENCLTENEILSLMIKMQILNLNYNPLLKDAKFAFYAYLEEKRSNGIVLSLESLLNVIDTIITEYQSNINTNDTLTLV